MRSARRIALCLLPVLAVGALGFVSLDLAYLAAMAGFGFCLGTLAGRDA